MHVLKIIAEPHTTLENEVLPASYRIDETKLNGIVFNCFSLSLVWILFLELRSEIEIALSIFGSGLNNI